MFIHFHNLFCKEHNVSCRSCMVSSVTADAHISLANAVIGTWISLDDFSDRPFLLVCRFLGEKWTWREGRTRCEGSNIHDG